MRSSILSRLLAGMVAIALAAAGTIVAGAADEVAVVQEMDTAAYPQVAARLSLPSDMLQEGTTPSFTVLENGIEVEGVKGTGDDAADTNAILVIDTSGSMEGEALAAAQAAARRFVASMGVGTQIAIIGFSDRPRVLTDFTTDVAALEAAIEKMDARGETALYDALSKAALMGGGAGGTRTNVVVLSDGGDTASVNTLQSAVSDLKAKHMPVYSVALNTKESNTAALKTLSARTGGRSYRVSQTSKLEPLFEGIADELNNVYTVAFKSRQPNTKDLEYDITAQLGGKTALARTVTPNPLLETLQETAGAAQALKEPAPASPALLSMAGIAAFGAIALLIGGLMLLFLRPTTTLGQVRAYDAGGYSDDLPTAEGTESDGVRSRMVDAVGYVAGRSGALEMIGDRLARAGLPLRPAESIAAHVALVIVGGVAVQVMTGKLPLAVITVLVLAFGPIAYLNLRVSRRTAHFQEQLPDALNLIAGSLRAGWGLQQAIELVAQETTPPISTEFRRAQTTTRLGLPVEDALEAMADRVDSVDFHWVVAAIAIQREVGGNLAEVLDIVANTIHERDALRRHVRALTAEGRLSAIILVILPFFVLAMLMLINPTYIARLVSSPFGMFLAVFGLVLLVVGIVWLRNVTKVEV